MRSMVEGAGRRRCARGGPPPSRYARHLPVNGEVARPLNPPRDGEGDHPQDGGGGGPHTRRSWRTPSVAFGATSP
jgi:hypothetical protein